jgi:hypothetical protein
MALTETSALAMGSLATVKSGLVTRALAIKTRYRDLRRVDEDTSFRGMTRG